MPDLPWLLIFRFGVCTVVGCVAVSIDWRERKIPNWLTVPLCLAGFIARGATEYGSGLLDALAGFGVGFAIFFVLWILGSGAGDVKFMAAVGTWLGPYHTFVVIVFSAFLMLLCILVLLIGRVLFRSASASSPEDEQTSLLTHTVPYALPATLAIALRLVHLLLMGRHS